MKNKNALALLFVASIVAACTSAAQVSPSRGGSVHATRPQPYVPAPPPSQYGEWWIEPNTCTIRARAADFSLINDGKPSNGTINLRVLFTSPLVQPPMAEVSEILVPVPVEGTRRGYSIILAYDSANAAHMMKPDTYLIVRYQPLTSTQVLESSFNTRGLMFALADLAKTCNP